MALRTIHCVPRHFGAKIIRSHASAAGPARLKRVTYMIGQRWKAGRSFASRLRPYSDRDQHQKNRERFLQLRPGERLGQPRTSPRSEEEAECDPERRRDVEMSAPVVFPRTKRSDRQQQRAE